MIVSRGFDIEIMQLRAASLGFDWCMISISLYAHCIFESQLTDFSSSNGYRYQNVRKAY